MKPEAIRWWWLAIVMLISQSTADQDVIIMNNLPGRVMNVRCWTDSRKPYEKIHYIEPGRHLKLSLPVGRWWDPRTWWDDYINYWCTFRTDRSIVHKLLIYSSDPKRGFTKECRSFNADDPRICYYFAEPGGIYMERFVFENYQLIKSLKKKWAPRKR